MTEIDNLDLDRLRVVAGRTVRPLRAWTAADMRAHGDQHPAPEGAAILRDVAASLEEFGLATLGDMVTAAMAVVAEK
ncbi:hypothetical protein FOS14_09000 [Skermania sp. ID1734]|uniref:hypothetical protein n=1 Tax=Skermania sp. ID1734 TaxID=2597516 RepID=UPI00117F8758|nr:hypothetical protein [Skermania sp. ID1734]TSD99960.1 hypothetical protein FOS14_09000 [Skermania sp. ID1734]